MIEVRNGSYGFYKGIPYKLIRKFEGDFVLQARYEPEAIIQGFKPYNHENLSNMMYKKVLKDEIESAFYAETYCLYQGLKFKMDGTINERDRTYRIWPLFESFDALKITHRDDSTHFWVSEEELNSIWEVREPFLDFPFEVDRVCHLKNHT
jgi:hypothetical protein